MAHTPIFYRMRRPIILPFTILDLIVICERKILTEKIDSILKIAKTTPKFSVNEFLGPNMDIHPIRKFDCEFEEMDRKFSSFNIEKFLNWIFLVINFGGGLRGQKYASCALRFRASQGRLCSEGVQNFVSIQKYSRICPFWLKGTPSPQKC